jgi:hypothetical protein
MYDVVFFHFKFESDNGYFRICFLQCTNFHALDKKLRIFPAVVHIVCRQWSLKNFPPSHLIMRLLKDLCLIFCQHRVCSLLNMDTFFCFIQQRHSHTLTYLHKGFQSPSLQTHINLKFLHLPFFAGK